MLYIGKPKILDVNLKIVKIIILCVMRMWVYDNVEDMKLFSFSCRKLTNLKLKKNSISKFYFKTFLQNEWRHKTTFV